MSYPGQRTSAVLPQSQHAAPQLVLPPGWERAYDPSSGRYYYKNHRNHTTQWEPPAEAVPVSATSSVNGGGLGGSRGAAGSGGSGSNSIVSSVAAPLMQPYRGADAASSNASGVRAVLQQPNVASLLAPAPAVLPAGWSSRVDPRSGRTYYLDNVNKTTTWEVPRGPAVLAGGAHAISSSSVSSSSASSLSSAAAASMGGITTGGMGYVSASHGGGAPLAGANGSASAEAAASAAARAAAMVNNNQGIKGAGQVSVADRYKEVLRACTVDNRVTHEELEFLSGQRERLGLTNEDHVTLLGEIGISESAFEQMRLGTAAPAFGGREDEDEWRGPRECVLCLSSGSTHVVLDCMHMCLCEECADALKHQPDDRRVCPMCRAPVVDIRKVF